MTDMAMARTCGKLEAENKQLRAANAKLRETLKISYDAMKTAIGRCRVTVDEILSEDPEIKDKRRLSIFRDLDIPLAQAGSVYAASDEALAAIDEMIERITPAHR